ncbi:MAG: RNA polymerase sigma-70 factor [Bacteroidales bacterium]|nr:RNA polymerase sigma-70 factor [Bacteroidales bacterium]
MKAEKPITDDQIHIADLAAFETLFNKHYAGLINYCKKLIDSEESSREIIQDVFLRLWEKRKLKTLDCSLKAYLFTAVHNRAMNHLRHNKISRSYGSEIWTEWLQAPKLIQEPNPFVREALENAISNLPERARDCFCYTQIDGLSHKETAELMGISVKTVENHINRARMLLKHKLRHFKT